MIICLFLSYVLFLSYYAIYIHILSLADCKSETCSDLSFENLCAGLFMGNFSQPHLEFIYIYSYSLIGSNEKILKMKRMKRVFSACLLN